MRGCIKAQQPFLVDDAEPPHVFFAQSSHRHARAQLGGRQRNVLESDRIGCSKCTRRILSARRTRSLDRGVLARVLSASECFFSKLVALSVEHYSLRMAPFVTSSVNGPSNELQSPVISTSSSSQSILAGSVGTAVGSKVGAANGSSVGYALGLTLGRGVGSGVG